MSLITSLVFQIAFLKISKIYFRNSHPELVLGRDVLKICSKFTGEHPCRSVISIKLLCNFTEITPRHWSIRIQDIRISGYKTSAYQDTKYVSLYIRIQGKRTQDLQGARPFDIDEGNIIR